MKQKIWGFFFTCTVYSKNNKGPSTEPWRTSELTGISDELSPSSTTVWDCPVRKAFFQDRVLPLTPCWWSLCNSFIWFTLSNALLKSSKIRSVCRPWEVLRASSSTSWMSWVWQDLLSRKPCWRSYRISFCSKCLDRFEATMCSITLQRMQSYVSFIHIQHQCFKQNCRKEQLMFVPVCICIKS